VAAVYILVLYMTYSLTTSYLERRFGRKKAAEEKPVASKPPAPNGNDLAGVMQSMAGALSNTLKSSAAKPVPKSSPKPSPKSAPIVKKEILTFCEPEEDAEEEDEDVEEDENKEEKEENSEDE